MREARVPDVAALIRATLVGYLEDFPKYAIRRAAKWTIVSKDKLLSVSAFIADVKMAVGENILERRKLLLRVI
jgi:hypothetical protein